MRLNDFIFTSYCFDNEAAGGDYKAQQDRLKETILSIYPNANLHLKHEPEHRGKPKFQQSMYGYKVHLVKECIAKGFNKIIYFDTAITLSDTVDYWFNIISDYGVLSAIDRKKLNTCTSNKCLKYLNLNRDEISEWHLTGGSIYVFDFNLELCRNIFKIWEDLEMKGMFGTQEEESNNANQGHRMDESCMALSLYLNGSQPLGHDIIRYAYENADSKQLHGGDDYKPLVIKKHFK